MLPGFSSLVPLIFFLYPVSQLFYYVVRGLLRGPVFLVFGMLNELPLVCPSSNWQFSSLILLNMFSEPLSVASSLSSSTIILRFGLFTVSHFSWMFCVQDLLDLRFYLVVESIFSSLSTEPEILSSIFVFCWLCLSLQLQIIYQWIFHCADYVSYFKTDHWLKNIGEELKYRVDPL